MSGIFGIFNRQGNPVARPLLEKMQQTMLEWGTGSIGMLIDVSVGMGQMRLFSTPEARYEKMSVIDKARGIIFTAAGRVDNREGLIAECGMRKVKYSEISDGELMLHAYLKWGEDCPNRVYGDWSFAAYNQKERRLFLARDHHGITALYYYADSHVFAFASYRNALLALNLAPTSMDELYLAQVLVSWPAHFGERTIHKPIKRLPPSHSLITTPDEMYVRRYWRLEDTAELRLPKRGDYVDTFRDVFDEAVRCRLRAIGGIAVTLSGGLDSGAVTTTAARLLQSKRQRLTAFTSVPLSDTCKYVGERFGDELPFAQATAEYAGNVDLCPITAECISPIQAIRQGLCIFKEPTHGAVNIFWILDLMRVAGKCDCRTLLTGQEGNPGISWNGDVFSQSIRFQLRRLGWRKWSKEAAKRYFPVRLLNTYRNIRNQKNVRWKSSAIHPDFANCMNLYDLLMKAPETVPRSSRELRHLILQPGRNFGGAWWAENGAAYGLEVRDPTADVRVLAFTLSVPDRIFMDPETGMDRWLIREAMKGRMPDEVRLNRERGLQSADLVLRLRACASEVDTALDELARGPAAAYVNVPYMREVWQMIRTEDTPEVHRKAVTILTRGIMAGLFVNGFGKW